MEVSVKGESIMKKLIKFKEAGKWSDHPQDPVFEVKANEEKEVSEELAKIAVKAGKAVYVEEKAKVLKIDGTTKPINPTPDKADKAKSKNPAPDKKDKAKANHD